MAVNVYYDKDCDLSLIKGKKVRFLTYVILTDDGDYMVGRSDILDEDDIDMMTDSQLLIAHEIITHKMQLSEGD